jgi:hypothetical protein
VLAYVLGNVVVPGVGVVGPASGEAAQPGVFGDMRTISWKCAPTWVAMVSKRSISSMRPRYCGMITSRPSRRWVSAILKARAARCVRFSTSRFNVPGC